jgi:hypothetical protein
MQPAGAYLLMPLAVLVVIGLLLAPRIASIEGAAFGRVILFGTTLGALAASLELGQAAIRLNPRVTADVAFFGQNVENTAAHVRCGRGNLGTATHLRIANARQHIGYRICHSSLTPYIRRDGSGFQSAFRANLKNKLPT